MVNWHFSFEQMTFGNLYEIYDLGYEIYFIYGIKYVVVVVPKEKEKEFKNLALTLKLFNY